MSDVNVIKDNGDSHLAESMRACQYAVLSRFFFEQTTVTDILQYLHILAPLVETSKDEAMTTLTRQLKSWVDLDGADHLLKTEYARLFIMPGGIRPYESVYRGEAPLLMQDPWLEVKRFYKECGLKLENPSIHPEDHVSSEFAFMVYLIETGGFENEEKSFYRRHLGCWAPRMLEDISQNRHARFFKDVADFGLSFLKEEHRFFGIAENESSDLAEQLQGSDQRDENGRI